VAQWTQKCLELLGQILFQAGARSLHSATSNALHIEGRQRHTALVPQPTTASIVAYNLHTLMRMSMHCHSVEPLCNGFRGALCVDECKAAHTFSLQAVLKIVLTLEGTLA